MNSNALNCFNKLIMHGAFLLKLFSNYHQTSIDMNTKYEHYRVNVLFFFFFFHSSIFNFSSPSILTKKRKEKGFSSLSVNSQFIYLYNSLHSSMKKVTSKIEAFPDSIFLIYQGKRECNCGRIMPVVVLVRTYGFSVFPAFHFSILHCQVSVQSHAPSVCRLDVYYDSYHS